MNETVIAGGGQVVLSGFGSDQYLTGPHWYIADLMTRGQFGAASRLLIDLAVGSRRSFYRAAFNNVIKPLAPKWLRRRWLNPVTALAPWIDRQFAKEANLAERLAFPHDESLGRSAFDAAQVNEIETIDLALERGVSEMVELRYPFLHRPLVEFSLSLPPSLRMRPNRPKWILRESLKDLLPPLVRERDGKGGIDGRIMWSFAKERTLLEELIDGSRLVGMRCLDGDGFRAAFAAARAGDVWSGLPMFTALALETWLAVQSGRWHQTVPAAAAVTAAVNTSTQGAQHVELH
jgi:asparagine synthase (glutamine-hydrolysing)